MAISNSVIHFLAYGALNCAPNLEDEAFGVYMTVVDLTDICYVGPQSICGMIRCVNTANLLYSVAAYGLGYISLDRLKELHREWRKEDRKYYGSGIFSAITSPNDIYCHPAIRYPRLLPR